ncbi:MAG: hypothetical protein ACTSYA_07970 [Candidatus Kariarchaeaceae archaeon]
MSADELLSSYNCSIADIEYILQFMKNQNISPQLALRRIKAFSTLEQKMEQSKDTKEKLDKLNSEVEEMNEEVNKLQEDKERILAEKEELESQRTELEKERGRLEKDQENLLIEKEALEGQTLQLKEEITEVKQRESSHDQEKQKLQEQISSLQQAFDEKEEESLEEDEEFQNIFTRVDNVKESLRNYASQNDALSPFLFEIISLISRSIENNEKMPEDFLEKLQSTIGTVSETVAKDSSEKEIKEAVSEKKEEKVLDEMTESVINLFIEYIEESQNNDDFRNRVGAMTDMDDSYELIGSIGLSQIYSYQMGDISMKEDLIALLNSWKESGIPR